MTTTTAPAARTSWRTVCVECFHGSGHYRVTGAEASCIVCGHTVVIRRDIAPYLEPGETLDTSTGWLVVVAAPDPCDWCEAPATLTVDGDDLACQPCFDKWFGAAVAAGETFEVRALDFHCGR